MTFTELPDLASRPLGGGVVDANDEFFAARDNLVNPEPSTFETWTFGPKGKVYDGWETRRRRTLGDDLHDWAVVRLGAPGAVHGVVVDTAHFTGNYPPHVSVDGCEVAGHPAPTALTGWFPLVERSAVKGDTRNLFEVTDHRRVTHVRLNIFPDGGVARLRVHGVVEPDPALLHGMTVDLAALELGGLVVDCSNRFYGSANNLILPGQARVMGDGWETARRRDDGNDWVLVRLAAPGTIRLAELDTTHFKGNAPGAARLRGTLDPSSESAWFDLLPRVDLQPDTRHRFRLDSTTPASHVRLDVYPDGGMARLRLFGEAV
ncbi:allantoicase [Dactylosporangium siamense]|uniref:Probable allantoicase n=1 Tax=Dactylosporangium siamense TaxID=685454 RepID=A0A919UBK1_9ACTN|nr:allantoicase [Dactylosporangium siamense]GIG49584.1 putative allantoicase [Dactylosporangium siamense]